jgi:cell division protein FtsI (penicillin-binding protein 3)
LNIKKDIRFRVYVAFTCICLFGAAILIKAATIQIKEGPQLRTLAKEMHTRNTALPAERGNIYTEDGLLLCSSIPQFDVHIDFSVISPKLFNSNVDTLAIDLSHLFNDETPSQYKQDLTEAYNSGDRYYELRKNLPYYQYEAVRSFPIFNKGKGYGGFIEDPKVKRVNPYGMLAYRTIGLWRENNKTIGLEATYDSVLNGEDGNRVEQKSTGNVWIPIEGSEVEAQNGKDLVTTLDIGIQDVAEHAMMSVLQQYECLYGTCIVMEVKTGKIKALVNLGRQQDGSYWEDFNYAMMPTEPGSTFKLVTLLSLLNDKYINVNDIVDAEGGAIRFGNRTMRDSHLGLHSMPIWKAYAESSNAAMAKLAYEYYYKDPGKYVNHLLQLHLDLRTGIDLAGERKPFVKKPENPTWSATTLPWMATGYEVLISPLHTCMLYNAVANGGTMLRPYLISSIREYGNDVKTFQPKVVVDHIGDSNVIAQLQKCMRAVITEGTGKGIESPYYTIAGKTGTAQVADKGIKYADKVYQGSFVGFFPADDPKYTICVVLRTKAHSNSYYGATIAAPVFRMISDKIFASSMGSWSGPLDSLARISNNKMQARQATASSYDVLLNAIGIKTPPSGIPSNQFAQLTTDTNKHIGIQPKQIYKGIMPDVTGMGLKDAVYMLESEGLLVSLQGRGKVQLQSLTAGTRITKGQNVLLQLN